MVSQAQRARLAETRRDHRGTRALHLSVTGQHATVLLMKETLASTSSSQLVTHYTVTTTPTGQGRLASAAARQRFTVPTRVPTPHMLLWDE